METYSIQEENSPLDAYAYFDAETGTINTVSYTHLELKGIKKYNVLIGTVLLVICCMGGTFAYFTYKESIKNQFTVGYNEIVFNETYNPPEEIKVGETTFRKNIKVSNTGTIPCYIRVFCEFSDSDMKKYAELTQDGINWFPADELNENLLKMCIRDRI